MMLQFYSYPALVTVLALIQYLFVSMNVGKARGKFNVPAPTTTGNPDFERYYRVQMNTLELIVIFLPSLWLFAEFWQAPRLASAVGLLWIIGRILYAQGYYSEAKKRGPGFGISALAVLILLLGSLIGIVRVMLA